MLYTPPSGWHGTARRHLDWERGSVVVSLVSGERMDTHEQGQGSLRPPGAPGGICLRFLRGPMAVAVFLLVLSGTACRDRTASAPDPSIEAFIRLAQSSPNHSWLEEEADEYVSALPNGTRIGIAERALQHSDPQIRFYGMQQLYELGLTTRGDEAAAELLLDGADLTGLGWAWMHSADSHLLEKRIAGISKAILAHHAAMTPEQLAMAKKFLCNKRDDCDIAALAAEQER